MRSRLAPNLKYSIVAIAVIISASTVVPPIGGYTAQGPPEVILQGSVPELAIATAQFMGKMGSASEISLALTLPLRNQTELKDLIRRLQNPADPLHGRYLTAAEFTSRFGPTQQDYDILAGFVRLMGLTITATHPNRLILDISAPVALAEAAFNVHLLLFRDSDGREFFAPDHEPIVPDYVASRLQGVLGLENASVWRSHEIPLSIGTGTTFGPRQIGTGPGGGLTPNDIRIAYNLNNVAANGTGQVLGLFELDGYTASDIAFYANYFGLPSVPLENVLVDGFSGVPGAGAPEVTLDIELQMALAPGATKIIVYEGPNSSTGVIDTYNRIATDNLAKQTSTSWGLSEDRIPAAVRNAEDAIFQQMAAQGQSLYAASGDRGAYDIFNNNTTLSVDDPASQPYIVGVGGTRLFTNQGGSYNHETTWNSGSANTGAGGGGISRIWSIPSWQVTAATQYQSASGFGSITMRNVPDISLDADPNSGYAIYFNGQWTIYGGTSCAAPLWAAFTALVNQQRTANATPLLGFANERLYQLAQGVLYSLDFNDVADASTNLFYPAATGYDAATGWGSFNGGNMWVDLSSPEPANSPTAPANLTATPGNSRITLNWSASMGAAIYTIYRGTSAGTETYYMSGLRTNSYLDTGVTVGTPYYYKVTASNSAGTSGFSNEASGTLVTISGLTANVTFPIAAAGMPVTWTATASGGLPPLQYQFFVVNVTANTSTRLQAYSTARSFLWTPGSDGTYRVVVWVRSTASTSTYDAFLSTGTFTILPPVTITGLTANLTFPIAAAGMPVTWTASASGGVAPLQIQFFVVNVTANTSIRSQTYGTATTFQWAPGSAGTYRIVVWVRSTGSAASWDSFLSTANLTILPPVTISSLTPNATFPLAAGTPVTWTTTASGGVVPLQYQFFIVNVITGTSTRARSYGPSNSFNWTPGSAGTYRVVVWVRSATSGAVWDAFLSTGSLTVNE